MNANPFNISELFEYRYMSKEDAASLDLGTNLQIAENAGSAVIRLADGLRAFGRIGSDYSVSGENVGLTMECAFSLVAEVSDLISSLAGIADEALERAGKT